MANAPLLTIRKDWPRPTADLLGKFAGYPLGWVCDSNGRQGALDASVRPIACAKPFVGSALTCFSSAGDNLGMHVALKYAKPGDVIIVAGERCTSCALTGDHMVGMAKNAGVVAVVTDAAVRDRAGLVGIGLPVYGGGINPNGPWKNGPGSVGLPISIGGKIVEPGDIVVGDEDNVVIIARGDAELVIEALADTKAKEEAMDDDIVGGGMTYAPIVDDALETMAVRWID